MTAEAMAIKFKSWAADKGLLRTEMPEDYQVDYGSLAELTTSAEAKQAREIFEARGINFVGFDDERNQVIVVTNGMLSKKAQEELPKEGPDGVAYSYVSAKVPSIKNATQTVVGHPPYAAKGGRYSCGSSISVGNKISAGTFGALVRDKSGEIFGLSNGHVTGECGYSEPGLPISAPGLLDVKARGRDPFTIGHHHKVAQLVLGRPENANVTENLDAATFKILDPDLVSSFQRQKYDTPNEVALPQLGGVVEKVGRTTAHTKGLLLGYSATPEPVSIDMGTIKGNIFFDQVLVVHNMDIAFAAGGDSGSLVCQMGADGVRRAIGLQFAGNGDKHLSYILPIGRILEHFQVELVSEHNI